MTAVLPLVIPSFVGAAAWKLTFERRGILEEWFGITSFPEMRGLTGATVVLVLFTYPYVYLPVAARLASLPPSLEENARILGRSPAYAFGRIVLPQCATAIAVGTLFVALYTVSDFGAVQMMGYDTLTRRLFANQLRQPDVATAMGLLLALLALVITVAERTVVRRVPPAAGIGARRALHVPLGRWRWPAVGAVVAVTFASLVAPITVFAWWIWRGTSTGAPRSVSTDLVGPALSSAQAGIVGRGDGGGRRPAAGHAHRAPAQPHGRRGRRSSSSPGSPCPGSSPRSPSAWPSAARPSTSRSRC